MNLLPISSLKVKTRRFGTGKLAGTLVSTGITVNQQRLVSRYDRSCRPFDAIDCAKQQVARELWHHLYGSVVDELYDIKRDLTNCLSDYPSIPMANVGLSDLRGRIDGLIKQLSTPPPVE